MLDPTPLVSKTPVIPVLTIERAADAAPLARALVAGGLPVIEVTLRTKAALDAIRALAAALADVGIPVLPGCATVSEAMALGVRGFKVLKFFPAEASGGVAWLKSIAAPLPEAKFCPTGGIDAKNIATYLACP